MNFILIQLFSLVLIFNLGILKSYAQEVNTDQSEGVILPKDKVGDLLKQCSRTTPDTTSYWVPSPEDIYRLEALLPEYIKSNPVANGCKTMGVNLSKYKRQYGGIGEHTMMEGGVIVKHPRSIYVNAFMSDPNDESWKNNPYTVCDGGCSAWGVSFDPRTGTFSNLSTNGFR